MKIFCIPFVVLLASGVSSQVEERPLSTQVTERATDSVPTRSVCNVELIEVKRTLLRQQGIDLDPVQSKGAVSPVEREKASAFRTLVKSLENNGSAETLFSAMLKITHGETGMLSVSNDSRDLALRIVPQTREDSLGVAIEFKVAHPKVNQPRRDAESVSFDFVAELGMPYVMDVTQLFDGKSDGQLVFLVLTMEQRR